MPYPSVRVLVTGFIAVSDLKEFLPKIENLFEKQEHVFQQLMTKCMFPKHELSDRTRKIFDQLGLLEKDGSIKDAVSTIVTNYVESQPKDSIEFYRKTACLLRGGVLERKISDEAVKKELEEYAKEVFRKKVDRAGCGHSLPSIGGKIDLTRCPKVIKNDPYACSIASSSISDQVKQSRIGVAHRLSGSCSDPLPKETDCVATKPVTSLTSESLSSSSTAVLETKDPVNATLTAKTLDYLSNHKYELLFMTALISYGIYDYYHENHIGKTAVAMKNGLFSLWEEADTPKDAATQEKNQEKTAIAFSAPGSSCY